MEAPLCKICGSKHWPRQPHAGEPELPVEPKQIPHLPLPKNQVVVNQFVRSAMDVAAKGKFDRTAYQRELMRKRRAAQKGKPPNG